MRSMGLMNEGLISGSGELQFMSTGTLNQPGRIEVGEGDHLLFSGPAARFKILVSSLSTAGKLNFSARSTM